MYYLPNVCNVLKSSKPRTMKVTLFYEEIVSERIQNQTPARINKTHRTDLPRFPVFSPLYNKLT